MKVYHFCKLSDALRIRQKGFFDENINAEFPNGKMIYKKGVYLFDDPQEAPLAFFTLIAPTDICVLELDFKNLDLRPFELTLGAYTVHFISCISWFLPSEIINKEIKGKEVKVIRINNPLHKKATPLSSGLRYE